MKKEKERPDKILALRIPAALYEQITKAASMDELPVSTWIRQQAAFKAKSNLSIAQRGRNIAA